MSSFKLLPSPTRFINSKKQSPVKVRLRLSHEDYAIVEAIVHSGRFSYRHPADFFRKAIHVLIDQLSAEEHLGRLVTDYNALQEERYRAMLEILARKVRKAVAERRFPKAHTLLESCIQQVRNEPRNAWRDWFLREIWEQLFPLAWSRQAPVVFRLTRRADLHSRRNGA